MGTALLTQKARDDLLAIGRYTRKQWGAAQQRRYLTQLDSAFHNLADKPGATVHEKDIVDGADVGFAVSSITVPPKHPGRGARGRC